MLVTGMICYLTLFYYVYKGFLNIRLAKLDLLFACIALYSLFNACSPQDINIFIRISILGGIWFFFRSLPHKRLGLAMTQWGMILSAVIQATIAMMQQSGILNSFHALFPTTGTLGNPGQLGGYIALGMSALFPRFVGFHHCSKGKQTVMVLCAVLLFYGLVIADSRAAWLAVFVALGVYWFSGKKSVSVRLLSVAFSLFVFLTIAFVSYRPGSAMARLKIWEVCFSLIRDAPVFGHGTGSFQRLYMDRQTDFISQASDSIKAEADDVAVAYNELISVLVEQGMTGFCLFMAFGACMFSLLWKRRAMDDTSAALLPILPCLIVFSLFSYPASIPAIYLPAMIMFSLTPLGKGKEAGKAPILLFALVHLTSISYFFYCHAYFWKNLGRYYRLEIGPRDIVDNRPVAWFTRHNPTCLTIAAEAYISLGDRTDIIKTCKRLILYRNESKWYMAMGDAHAQLKKYTEADACYQRVCRMRPGLAEPVYARFMLWAEEEPARAASIARHLLAMPVKKENRATEAMRKEAAEFLQKGPATSL